MFILDETEFFIRDRLARQSHETRRDRDGLVSSRLACFRDETVSLPALAFFRRGERGEGSLSRVFKLPTKRGGTFSSTQTTAAAVGWAQFSRQDATYFPTFFKKNPRNHLIPHPNSRVLFPQSSSPPPS